MATPNQTDQQLVKLSSLSQEAQDTANYYFGRDELQDLIDAGWIEEAKPREFYVNVNPEAQPTVTVSEQEPCNPSIPLNESVPLGEEVSSASNRVITLPEMTNGFIVGVTSEGNYVFEIVGTQTGLIELMGLLEYAKLRIADIRDLNQGRGNPIIQKQLRKVGEILSSLVQQSRNGGR